MSINTIRILVVVKVNEQQGFTICLDDDVVHFKVHVNQNNG